MHVHDGKPADNDGIAALQLHYKDGRGICLLHYMIFSIEKCFPNLNVKSMLGR